MYRITKRYGAEEGLSCAFRQWKAPETHCKFLHGYPLAFTIVFEGETLDERNWLISFGELKQVKEWLKLNFDHQTCVAFDDPELQFFLEMEQLGIIQLNIVKAVGCEKFAEWVYQEVNRILFSKLQANNVRIAEVTVSEHGGNSATYIPSKLEITGNRGVLQIDDQSSKYFPGTYPKTVVVKPRESFYVSTTVLAPKDGSYLVNGSVYKNESPIIRGH